MQGCKINVLATPTQPSLYSRSSFHKFRFDKHTHTYKLIANRNREIVFRGLSISPMLDYYAHRCIVGSQASQVYRHVETKTLRIEDNSRPDLYEIG